jgi:DEAD/DEAH box helicase domain-containing protein
VLAQAAEALGSERLRHVEHLPGRAARPAAWPDWTAPVVLSTLVGEGLDHPWSHQREAMDRAHAGEHVVLATGTASGKSLGYLVPALSAVHEGLTAPSGRGATVLYLSPTKALAADQRHRIESWALPGVRVATYDGDTPTDERRWVRDHAHVVLSNPDLLHHSLLPGHTHWRPFLRSLRYVVLDECHTYRGVFGSHVAAVIRRLRRVAARHGAHPTFVLASATVSDPAAQASRLIGMPVAAITEDGSPRGALTFALWEPPMLEDRRRSATSEAADLLAAFVERDLQTVAFARSRAGVEALASRARDRLEGYAPSLAASVAAYRGGYLPEERRALERDLRTGALRGLAATNALELGIDVSGLDAVVLAGWPGRRASLWQQAGRAGRDGREALAVLVAADDPLDTFLMGHPEAIFSSPVEATVLDPHNRHVLAPHLAAAAAELPLTVADLELFGPGARGAVDALVAADILRRRPSGWFWAREDRPADHVSLRGADAVVAIADRRTGRVLGTIDAASAHSQVHTGAVHVHQGRTHVVTELDLEAAVATVVPGDPGWSTHAQSSSSFRLVGTDVRAVHGPVEVGFGTVSVTTRVTGFLRRLPSGEVIGQHPLDLPERSLTTKGVWWTITPDLLADIGVPEEAVPGALHAAEHAAIGLMPLVATSDRWDIGGVSTALHPDTGLPTILVYDGYPGGAGFAERAHGSLTEWWLATLDAIAGCRCASGCPSCVQSPKCGNGNEPLDKWGAVRVLRACLTALGERGSAEPGGSAGPGGSAEPGPRAGRS